MGGEPKFAFSSMNLSRLGNLIFVEPIVNGKTAGPSLTVELASGTVGVAEHTMPLGQSVGHKPRRIWGIIGLAQLINSTALAVITAAKQVAVLQGHPVYEVTGTDILHIGADAGPNDQRYLRLLGLALDPSGAGQGLFFSYGADLTLTEQRRSEVIADAKLAGAPLWRRAEERFFFNRHLTRPLTDTTRMAMQEGGPEVDLPAPAELASFVLPLVQGAVMQMGGLELLAHSGTWRGSLTLVARRSWHRPGVRHWRRGADSQGAVANFVETEQIVVLAPDGRENAPATVASFVQVRGSIPLLWSQVPNIKYKPTTRLAPPDACTAVFDAHMAALVAAYQGVLAVNLANQHGSEGVLGREFDAQAKRFAAKEPALRLVSFDFHKECGSTRYDRLEGLFAQISKEVERYGWYQRGGPPGTDRIQQGVLRTNCIDCLDRTNVVQCWIARKQLEKLLTSLGVLRAGQTLPGEFPTLEAEFKWMWADHGDAMSRQYAGTGALKSGFTRTGKRTLGGLLDDGWKSAARYYLNNFRDGRKQDALDLATGTFTLDRGKPLALRTQPSPGLPVLVALLSLAWGAYNAAALTTGGRERSASAFLQTAVLPLGLAAVILVLLVKNGKHIVCRPQLRPDLAQPW